MLVHHFRECKYLKKKMLENTLNENKTDWNYVVMIFKTSVSGKTCLAPHMPPGSLNIEW